jgi:hypothetical protein
MWVNPPEWREYAAGGAAAALGVVFTFPINKAMFRQQVHNIPTADACRQLRDEGLGSLYRGVLSPLLMKALSSSVMFGSYSQYSRILQQDRAWGVGRAKAAAAVMAGASEAMLMPLERVQVLMQDQANHARFRNTPHALFSLRAHGVTEYYRGFTAILLRNCPGNVIFFTCREDLKERLAPKAWATSYVFDFLGGACLGAFISTMFFPVNVTKTHMQLVVGGPFLRFRTVFAQLWQERGLVGMFRGVHVNYTRSFLSWGIVNVTYEKILDLLRTWT